VKDRVDPSAPIVSPCIVGASKISKDVFCGCVVTGFGRGVVLRETHDRVSDVWSRVHSKVQEFADEFPVFGLEVVNVRTDISGMAKWEVRVG